MACQQLWLFLGDLRKLALEHVGDAGVQRATWFAQQCAVGRILHQGVLEDVDCLLHRSESNWRITLAGWNRKEGSEQGHGRLSARLANRDNRLKLVEPAGGRIVRGDDRVSLQLRGDGIQGSVTIVRRALVKQPGVAPLLGDAFGEMRYGARLSDAGLA